MTMRARSVIALLASTVLSFCCIGTYGADLKTSLGRDIEISIDSVPINDVMTLPVSDRPHSARFKIAQTEIGVTAVYAYLNGQRIFGIEQKSQALPLDNTVPIALRPYGNELSVALKYANGDVIVRSVYPFVQQEQDEQTNQWAIVMSGSNESSAKSAKAFADRLRSVVGTRIVELNDANTSPTMAISAIYRAVQGMRAGDHLIFFYSGFLDDPDSGESCLITSLSSTPEQCLSLEIFARITSHLRIAQVSAILDLQTRVTDKTSQAETRSFYDSRIEAKQSWTQSLSYHPHFELLLSKTVGDTNASGPSVFAKELVDWWDNREMDNSCRSAVDLYKYLRNTHETPGTRSDLGVPVYLSTVGAKDSMCLSPSDISRLALAVTRIEGNKATITAATSLPLSVAEAVVSVNGVPIIRNSPPTNAGSTKFECTVPLSPGLNWVSVAEQSTSTTIRKGGILAIGPKRGTTVIQRAAADYASTRITLEQPLTDYTSTERDDIVTTFTVHDHDTKESPFQVLNNGVIVNDGNLIRTHLTDSLQKTVSVPLQAGMNNIVIRVNGPKSDSLKTITVYHIPSHPVVALLVAAENGSAANSPQSYSKADARLMRQLLLRYTDAAPSDVIILDGEQATSENILKTLRDFAAVLANQGSMFGTPAALAKATLVVYFSGYGVVVRSGDSIDARTPAVGSRCLWTYSTEPNNISSCLMLAQLLSETAVSRWNNSLIVLDTSFEGASGVSESNLGISNKYVSRTLAITSANRSDRINDDPIGSNQTVVFASQPYQAALESERLGHGLFTYAIDNALKNATIHSSTPIPLIKLSDILESSNDYIEQVTQQTQTSYVEGDAAAPPIFRFSSSVKLRSMWVTALNKMARDLSAMRSIDQDTLQFAQRAIRKAEELDGPEPAVLTAKALAMRYEGISCKKPLECTPFLEADDLLREAELRLSSPTINDATPRDENGNMVVGKYGTYIATEKYVLYSVRAALNKQRGRIDRALDDATNARKMQNSLLRAELSLAELDLASGRLDEAGEHLDYVLNIGREHSDEASGMLSPSDWGKSVVWRAMLLHLSKRDSESDSLLEAYARRESRKYKSLVRPAAVATGSLLGLERVRQDQGVAASDDPWMVTVANYLLGHRSDQELQSYGRDQERGDRLLFECESSFYIGLRNAKQRNMNQARSMFQTAVDTGQTELGEYWFAKFFLSHPTVFVQ